MSANRRHESPVSKTAMKPQVGATHDAHSADEGVNPIYDRRSQIGEALWDLEQVFSNPGCFGGCTEDEAAESLSSEFVGAWRDDEILSRLDKFRASVADGKIKDAARHLSFVRRKLKTRWQITSLRPAPHSTAPKTRRAHEGSSAQSAVSGSVGSIPG